MSKTPKKKSSSFINVTVLKAEHWSTKRLIEWIRDKTNLNLHTTQQLSNGLAYGSLLQILLPEVNIYNKMYKNSSTEIHLMHNWKLIQTLFDKQNIYKPFVIDRMVAGKVTNHLDFLQWFRKFYEVNNNNNNKINDNNTNKLDNNNNNNNSYSRHSHGKSNVLKVAKHVKKSPYPLSSTRMFINMTPSRVLLFSDSMSISPEVNSHRTDIEIVTNPMETTFMLAAI